MDLFNRLVIGSMPLVPKPLVGRVASKYIAGETLPEAINEVKALNDEGAVATIDLLGEHCQSEADAGKAADMYHDILRAIRDSGVNSNISLKPTQLGLKISYDFCRDHILGIVDYAAELGNFVRIDMENHTCTDDTLKLYCEIHEKHENVGVVLQAYLRRTMKDITRLTREKANLRLCKGIYNEPRSIAYKNREIIIHNFAHLLERLLRAGNYVGIATHCEESIWHGLRIIDDLGLNKDEYEFQMLLGVDLELRRILIEDGHRMRVYVPYGEEWYAYSTRRLKENPSIGGAVARDFLGLSQPGKSA